MNYNPFKIKTFWPKASAFGKFLLMRYVPGALEKIRITPYQATLTVTDNCCLKCVMCNEWHTHHTEEFNTEEWKNALTQLKEAGIREINLTGGEPLMRKDIFEIVRHARSLGLRVGMTSNGFMMNEQRVAELIASGVSTFSLSMDAVGEKYDEIRGVKGGYDRLLRACELLSKERKEGKIDAYLCFLLMKETLDAYQGVLEVGRKLDLPMVVNLFDVNPYFFKIDGLKEKYNIGDQDKGRLKQFQRVMVENRSQHANATYHSFSEIKYFADYFQDPLQKNLPCSVSQIRVCVGAKGQIYGGCWAWRPLGDLRKATLKEILNSESFRRNTRKMFKKECPGCSCGFSLNLRYSPPNVLRESIFRLFPGTRESIYKN
ncbi:MAG: radical SAM protein [Candidatus Omnitrophica bacterium]|nr:radical SAM protein [Candidatus Omnitrophota bacterium]